MLTIKRVKELALKPENFNTGGYVIDTYYEDFQIETLIKSGIDTEEKLLNWFKAQYEHDEECRKAANWMAYGTTDEEELAEIHRAEAEPVTEESYDEPFDDPCYGCQRCDNSYNCKHCEYGDDGQYNSPWDVYTPSELGISVKW